MLMIARKPRPRKRLYMAVKNDGTVMYINLRYAPSPDMYRFSFLWVSPRPFRTQADRYPD